MTDTKSCPECGAENPVEMKFCEACGTSLEAADEPNSPGEESEYDHGHEAEDVEADDVDGEEAPDGETAPPPQESDDDSIAEQSHPEEFADDEFEAADEPQEGLESHDEYEIEAVDEPQDGLETHDEYEIEAIDEPRDDVDDEYEAIEEDAPGADEDFDSESLDEHYHDDDFGIDEVDASAEDVAEFEDSDVFAEELEGDEESGDEESDDEDPVVIEEPTASIEPQRSTERTVVNVDPLPTPGPHAIPPSLTIFHDQQALEDFVLETDVTYLGCAPGTVDPSAEKVLGDADGEEMDLEAFAGNVAERAGDIETFSDPAEDESEEGDEVLDEDELSESGDEVELAEDGESEPEGEFDDTAQPEDDDDATSIDESSEPENTAAALEESVVDLSSFGKAQLAKKHVAIFKQNKNYTLCVLADEPTQLNDEVLELGERRSLQDGDVIVVGETIALRFDLEVA